MSMKIDDVALDEIAAEIKKYCEKQIDLIEAYCQQIHSLEDSWDGDNYEDLLDKVEDIGDDCTQAIDDINDTYSQYFTSKAEMIRERPSFKGGSPVGSSSASSAQEERSSKSTFFDQVFKNYNKEVVTKIYNYLRRINFYVPNEKISFYDPFGKTKNGLYRNIMAIDINSPTFKQDMISLTGQHLFFQVQHFQKMELIRNLGVELENKSLQNNNEFKKLVNQIKNGSGIETKYITFPDNSTKTAFNFFTKAFQASMLNNTGELDKYNKYFSNSYGNFREILHGLISF